MVKNNYYTMFTYKYKVKSDVCRYASMPKYVIHSIEMRC